MARIIKSYDKLSPELLELFKAKYPKGATEDVIKTIKGMTGELITVVELSMDDDIYLVKVKPKLAKSPVPLKAPKSSDDDDDDDFEDDNDSDGDDINEEDLDGSGALDIGEDDPGMDF